MKLTFLGATGTVTGSRYLVEDDGKKFLVDCGLFQGLKELRLRNWSPLPVAASSISAIVLTHAHLDHSGYIPRLVKEGFKGPVYCSPATAELAGILLPDSGRIQDEDAARANRYGYTKHAPALALYTEQEARDCLAQFKPVDFGRRHALTEFLSFSLHRAGHILGASMVRMTDGGTTIVFSGDLGRLNDPVMKAPVPIEDTDYLVVESTYGNRLHGSEDPAAALEAVINRAVKRGGTVVIPAFAVGRAQLLMYYIYALKAQKRIPPHLPVYLDSPMAVNVSSLLCKYPNDQRLPESQCADVCSGVTYVTTREQSKQVDASNMPAVIISASGMATGGRVLHHLKRFAGDQRNIILLAGYQAAGTRGARLARGEKEIKIHGEMMTVRAEVVELPNMSAHADYAEILEWMGHFRRPPKKVFITHGEAQGAEGLQRRITEKFGWPAVVPVFGQSELL